MDTELGRITHDYWYVDTILYRSNLDGSNTQQWTGKAWVPLCFSYSKAA